MGRGYDLKAKPQAPAWPLYLTATFTLLSRVMDVYFARRDMAGVDKMMRYIARIITRYTQSETLRRNAKRKAAMLADPNWRARVITQLGGPQALNRWDARAERLRLAQLGDWQPRPPREYTPRQIKLKTAQAQRLRDLAAFKRRAAAAVMRGGGSAVFSSKPTPQPREFRLATIAKLPEHLRTEPVRFLPPLPQPRRAAALTRGPLIALTPAELRTGIDEAGPQQDARLRPIIDWHKLLSDPDRAEILRGVHAEKPIDGLDEEAASQLKPDKNLV